MTIVDDPREFSPGELLKTFLGILPYFYSHFNFFFPKTV